MQLRPWLLQNRARLVDEDFRRLGSGLTGHVYECYNRLRKRKVAVKVAHNYDEYTIRCLSHEVQVLQHIKRPHLLDTYNDRGVPCAMTPVMLRVLRKLENPNGHHAELSST